MLTNAKIEEARRNREIEITNYNPEHLGLYYYILTPARVITEQAKDDDSVFIDDARKKNLTDFPFPIAPNENVTVVFKERVILSKKYYGVLFSCSLCIEAGLHLTFGEIEPDYNDELRIGITNMSASEFVLRSKSELVKVRFEEFPEDARFLPLPDERKAHKELIEFLRGKRKELQRKTEEEIKKIDDQLKELSIR
jgi:deoxycytidine triphosphate deaminase